MTIQPSEPRRRLSFHPDRGFNSAGLATFAPVIDPLTIERILDASPIVEVISDFVTLKRRGVNYLGICPFHNEKTPSFTVSPSKGIFKCFGCGKGGNVVNFIMEHEGLAYPEAMKYLARKAHIEVTEREETAEEKQQKDERESMLIVTGYAKSYFARYVWEEHEGRSVGLSYFRERGMRDDTIRKFELGYCPDGRSVFTDAALKEGYRMEFLEKTGLTIRRDDWVRDRFAGRVMFPVHSVAGRVIAFGGRTLKSEPDTAKYLNSPESEIYHKSRVVYGIFQAKREIARTDKCFLVEGYTDVLSLHQAGIENVVASSGTALTSDQIRLIRRFTSNITILYDGDEAGVKASLRGIDLVLEEGMNVKVLLLPDGEDPDSFARAHGSSEFLAYIKENETDFIRFKTRLLLKAAGNDPIARSRLINEVIRSVAVIPDSVTRAVYIRETAVLLNVEEALLYSEVRKLLRSRGGITAPQAPVEKERTVRQTSFPESDFGELTAEEREFLKFLLKYCNQPLFEQDTGQPGNPGIVSVGDFLIGQVKAENMVSDHPLFRLIFEETETRMHGEDFLPDRYFIYHSDERISRLVTDLLTEKWVESRRWTKGGGYTEKEADILDWLVPRIFYEYKLSKIKKIHADLEKKLEMLHLSDEQEELMETLIKIQNLKGVEKFLSDKLGNRAII